MQGTYKRNRGFKWGTHFFKEYTKEYSLKRESDGKIFYIRGSDLDGYDLYTVDESASCDRDVCFHYDTGDNSVWWDEIRKFKNFIHAVQFLRENLEILDRFIPANTKIVWRYD